MAEAPARGLPGHTAEINPDGGTWNDCTRCDIAALMDCNTVAMLPGWEHSKGAQLEVLIADHLGMTVGNAHSLTKNVGALSRELIHQDLGIESTH
ncbi:MULTISPECIES: DUF4406 domain-containing protein [unclassified Pseudomonas]|uniref:DUF4406 domain-containing protein n=1 Tax=unclassified Pseudomonas TaxID=196821 RepID=UPI000F9E09C7|nr:MULTISPECIES: DUF4406 domain-containing protein [unclassified Pseudomonas]